jgi:hypothetical protein
MEGQYYLLKILGTGQAVAVFQSWHLLVNPQDILAVYVTKLRKSALSIHPLFSLMHTPVQTYSAY